MAIARIQQTSSGSPERAFRGCAKSRDDKVGAPRYVHAERRRRLEEHADTPRYDVHAHGQRSIIRRAQHASSADTERGWDLETRRRRADVKR